MNPLAEAARFFRAALVVPVERQHRESDAAWRRRRLVVAGTLVVGAGTLGLALAIPAGDPRFYLATAAVALVWVLGAVTSGRLYLGRAHTRAGATSLSMLQGLILGGLLLAAFLAGAVAVARLPPLRAPVDALLDHARGGSLPVVALITAVNGVAEELFFRGAVYAALPRRFNVVGSAGLYAASTLLSGVSLLTFAAVCLGLLTGLQRRVTGGVLGPVVTHLTWSLGMLFCLPWAFTL